MDTASLTVVSTELLTKREQEVAYWNALGKTNDEIALILGIGPATVKTHLEHICDKLHCYNRTAAVTEAFRHGILKFLCVLLALAAQAGIELRDDDALRPRQAQRIKVKTIRNHRPGRRQRRELWQLQLDQELAA